MLRAKTLTALILATALAAVPASAQDTGSADFTRFVALGDSLGAAFVSGGLVTGAQENSVPALVARQAAGATIEQPLIGPPGLPPLLVLQSLSPLRIVPAAARSGPPLNLNLPRPYDNLSVPGFDVGDALTNRARPGTDLASLILRFPNTMLEQAISLQPTFAMVWLGNNDVLGAAVSGRTIDGVTLTPPAQFEAQYTQLVGALAGAGADLVLATLPDVTSIPFVTTIPPVVVDPTTGQPVLGPDGNPIPLLGPGGQPLPPGSLVLLPASAKLARGIGIPPQLGGSSTQFLGDEDFLSPAEVGAIRDRVNTFNAIIRATANATGAALAEIGELLSEAAGEGVDIGGIEFTAEFVTGGVISLDGIHPTPLGYAVAANEFIEAINEQYGAEIELVDLFPFLFGADAFALPPGAATASLTGMVYSGAAGRQMRDVLNVDRPSKTGDDGGERDGSEVARGIRDKLPQVQR